MQVSAGFLETTFCSWRVSLGGSWISFVLLKGALEAEKLLRGLPG